MRAKAILIGLALLLAVTPALAQESTTHTVAFDGFRFSFDEALARNVNISQHVPDPAEDGPWFAEPRYTQFALYNEFPVPESLLDVVGSVRVYRLADLAGYDEDLRRAEQLRALLTERPDLTPYMAARDNASENTLPFLPVFPAAQIVRARAHYLDAPAVSGISFVTVYSQGIGPLLADEFLWTFQGLSANGEYYVMALFPLHTGLFPQEVGAGYDPDALIARLVEYLNESIATLNAASPSDFSPSLDALDALVSTFAFGE